MKPAVLLLHEANIGSRSRTGWGSAWRNDRSRERRQGHADRHARDRIRKRRLSEAEASRRWYSAACPHRVLGHVQRRSRRWKRVVGRLPMSNLSKPTGFCCSGRCGQQGSRLGSVDSQRQWPLGCHRLEWRFRRPHVQHADG